MGKKKVAPASKTEASEAEETQSQCENFNRCGNTASQGHEYCDSCHLEWRQSKVKTEDANTRPLRAELAQSLSRSKENLARYYKSEDSAKWPKEVRAAIQTAEAALVEGDQKALEGSNPKDPNPGLFSVARGIYFAAKNELSVAEYHSFRISLQGVLKGVPGFVARDLRKELEGVEKTFALADKMSGYKKTRQLRQAARDMRSLLYKARKERDSLQKGDAENFYSAASDSDSSGAAIGDILTETVVEELSSKVAQAETRRKRAAAKKAEPKPKAKAKSKGRKQSKLQDEIEAGIEEAGLS